MGNHGPQNQRGMDPSHPKTTKPDGTDAPQATDDDAPRWEDELVGGLVGSVTSEQQKNANAQPSTPGRKKPD